MINVTVIAPIAITSILKLKYSGSNTWLNKVEEGSYHALNFEENN